jgi:hypothetical protein
VEFIQIDPFFRVIFSLIKTQNDQEWTEETTKKEHKVLYTCQKRLTNNSPNLANQK